MSKAHYILACFVLLGGCKACPPPSADASADVEPDCRSTHPAATLSYLEDNETRYIEARAKARGWLDELVVEPKTLRTHGIKGKKKLVEQLDGYVWMLRDPRPGEKPALMKRVEKVVAVTYTDDYHDMAIIDDKQFKQDATSYMRAAYLMDSLEMDTTFYKKQMAKVIGRYDSHMPKRGPAQQMIFHVYYGHFGFEEPFALDKAFEKGIITKRADPETMKRMEMYHLTHEIFMPFRYGEIRQSDFFDEGDVEYLAKTLPVMVRRRMEVRDPDLVAELVLCMEYLDLEDDTAYRQGIGFILDSQNTDGSWGHYPDADRMFGSWASYHIYLHTTKLALSALVNAYRCPE